MSSEKLIVVYQTIGIQAVTLTTKNLTQKVKNLNWYCKVGKRIAKH
jgi:hypothetical protein